MARRGQKRKPGPRAPEPGRKRQPEDKMRAAALDAERPWRARRARQPAPKLAVTPGQAIPRTEVAARLVRAMKTLRSVPDRERRFFQLKGGSPDYVRDFQAYANDVPVQPRFIPSPFDVSDYLTALSWARHLPTADWKILWLRSFDYSFGLIAEYIGRSDETARRRYEAIITDVWCAANNVA